VLCFHLKQALGCILKEARGWPSGWAVDASSREDMGPDARRGWVCATSSQFMQPQPLLAPQLTLESVERAQCRRKRKVVDADVRGRLSVGKKPNQVRMKAGGEIAGGCHRKNAWDAAVRTAVPRILDMNVLSWEGKSTEALNELRDRLDRDFEYVGYNLSKNGFRNVVKRFMKTERSRL
jgi:hypothetical protein